MIANGEQAQNEAAYDNLRPTIDRAYPKGRFVAIYGGRIVADAATLPELLGALAALGLDPQKSLAVQAGVHHPDFVYILLSGARHGSALNFVR
jgi:hypothetical protein